MTNDHQPNDAGELLIYRDDDGSTVRVLLEGESVWLTQAQIAELYQTTPQNITQHLKAIYDEGELKEAATCKDYLQVRQEGKRNVPRHRVTAMPSPWKTRWLYAISDCNR